MTDWTRRAPKRRLLAVLASIATLGIVATGCTGGNGAAHRTAAKPDDPGSAGGTPTNTLTVYSRDREIAQPLFEQFERETGIKIRARWGDPIELAKQIIKDGADSPADVYYGPLSDALGSLAAAGSLVKLSDEQLSR